MLKVKVSSAGNLFIMRGSRGWIPQRCKQNSDNEDMCGEGCPLFEIFETSVPIGPSEYTGGKMRKTHMLRLCHDTMEVDLVG